MHSTSLLGLLKEFRGQNLQNFVPSAYAFGRRPNLLKCELRLQPNVKNMALVIPWLSDYFVSLTLYSESERLRV